MAQFGLHGSWKGIVALASLFAFIGLLTYAIVAGQSFGVTLYLLAILAIGFGFASKEDTIAVGGIIAISLLSVLDVLLRVGVLSFNYCHGSWDPFFGCP